MAHKQELPKREPDSLHGEKITHPSYATVNISRCSGSVELFDSSFQHQYFISLSINHAEKCTDGTHDFIFGKDQIVEVWMSETQFARAITSMNMGSGAPCTLVHNHDTEVPAPQAEDLMNSHTTMVENKLQNVMHAQLTLGKKINQWREEKHRPTLKEMDKLSQDMHGIAANFEENMGFYAQCFEEHTEKVVDEAKAEIEAHILSVTGRLGIPRNELPSLGFDKEEQGGTLE